MAKTKQLAQIAQLNIEQLEENEGQLAGLPSNPREIAEEKFELLKEDISKYPEFLNINALKVYPIEDGKYIVIGGNMRFRALKELGYTEVPCAIIPQETTIEQLKAYTILDNSGFGRWNWTKLTSDEWDSAQLSSWGVDMMIMGDDGGEWDNIADIEGEPQEPTLFKPIRIVVNVPHGENDTADNVRNEIKEIIGKYVGVEMQ